MDADGVFRDLDDDLLALPDEVVDARAIRALGSLAVRRTVPVLFAEIEVPGGRDDVLDVEKGIAVQADRHERGLHPRQHAVHAPEIDVADEALPAPPLVKDLDDAAVLGEGDPRLRWRRVDEELFPHALANRRYSTPRIRPMARNVVAIEDPP